MRKPSTHSTRGKTLPETAREEREGTVTRTEITPLAVLRHPRVVSGMVPRIMEYVKVLTLLLNVGGWILRHIVDNSQVVNGPTATKRATIEKATPNP